MNAPLQIHCWELPDGHPFYWTPGHIDTEQFRAEIAAWNQEMTGEVEFSIEEAEALHIQHDHWRQVGQQMKKADPDEAGAVAITAAWE